MPIRTMSRAANATADSTATCAVIEPPASDVLGDASAELAMLGTTRESGSPSGMDVSEALARIGRALASKLSIDESLQVIADAALEAFRAQAVTVHLAETGGAQLVLRSAIGPARAELKDLQDQAPEVLTEAVLRTRKAVQVTDLLDDGRVADHITSPASLSSYVAVPMETGSRAVGVLAIGRREAGALPPADRDLLRSFAGQAAAAVENALLYREAVQERQRLQSVFDNASDGIAIIGPDQRIIAFNRAMEALTGWRAEDAIHSRCEHVYQSHDEKGISLCHSACPMASLYNRGLASPYVETILTTRDGKQRDVAISYSTIAPPDSDDPAAGQVVAIVRDISRSKEIERAKSQFVSTVSHELRTPLASIKASVGVLLASMSEDTAEPILRLLRNIDRSTQRLESMVVDLLDLARLQNGRVKLSIRRVDLSEIAGEALSTIRPLCDEKGQTARLVAPKKPLFVEGDRQRLGQVLLNLLSNANKYTPEGGEIVVRLARRGDEVVVSVSDTGPGIALEEQERIFERFYRPENGSTQGNVGTGLGLPIAKALVELHGGCIWLRSEPGKGSTFLVSVPREASRAPRHPRVV